MTDPFKIGDVVRLNSGGPNMTVHDIRNEDDVVCTWFEKARQCEGVFKTSALSRAHSSSPIFGTVIRS